MAHHKGESWNDRELNRSPLTVPALEAATKAITSTIRDFPEGSGHTQKGHLLNRLAQTVGHPFPTDLEGHPTLNPHHHHDEGLPKTIGEMKQRLDRLTNQLSSDQSLQDMCRTASGAAVDAAKAAMQPAQGKH